MAKAKRPARKRGPVIEVLDDAAVDREIAKFEATATPEELAWAAEMERDLEEAFALIRADRAERLARGEPEPADDDLPEAPPLAETMVLMVPKLPKRKRKPTTPKS